MILLKPLQRGLFMISFPETNVKHFSRKIAGFFEKLSALSVSGAKIRPDGAKTAAETVALASHRPFYRREQEKRPGYPSKYRHASKAAAAPSAMAVATWR